MTFLLLFALVACSAQSSSSLSPGAIAGVATAAVVASIIVMLIFVMYVYKVRKSRGSTLAAHHSAPEPSHLHYPHQQGVTFNIHSGKRNFTFCHVKLKQYSKHDHF